MKKLTTQEFVDRVKEIHVEQYKIKEPDYWLDGYDKENNMYNKLIQKDVNRQQEKEKYRIKKLNFIYG